MIFHRKLRSLYKLLFKQESERTQIVFEKVRREKEERAPINKKRELNIVTLLSRNLDILQDVVYDYMHLCCEGYIMGFLKLIMQP